MRNLFALLLVGLMIYAIISLVQRSRPGPGGPTRGGGPRPGRKPGPVAPDDDPAFLWQLDQERRRAAHDSDHPEATDDGSDQDHPGTRGSTT